ncbi:hypothetical protein OAI46_06295 [Alphaproteobacteria bacterium]|nr:hypothetical protein [Alphaproteobacteria bacterium]
MAKTRRTKKQIDDIIPPETGGADPSRGSSGALPPLIDQDSGSFMSRYFGGPLRAALAKLQRALWLALRAAIVAIVVLGSIYAGLQAWQAYYEDAVQPSWLPTLEPTLDISEPLVSPLVSPMISPPADSEPPTKTIDTPPVLPLEPVIHDAENQLAAERLAHDATKAALLEARNALNQRAADLQNNAGSQSRNQARADMAELILRLEAGLGFAPQLARLGQNNLLSTLEIDTLAPSASEGGVSMAQLQAQYSDFKDLLALPLGQPMISAPPPAGLVWLNKVSRGLFALTPVTPNLEGPDSIQSLNAAMATANVEALTRAIKLLASPDLLAILPPQAGPRQTAIAARDALQLQLQTYLRQTAWTAQLKQDFLGGQRP